jgi:hypothetical protein
MRFHLALLPVAAALATACAEPPDSPTAVSTTNRPSFARPAADVSVRSELLGGGASATLSIQSDQLGVYTNGGGVSSIIQGTFPDWVLDLSAKKSTRKASVALTDPVPGNPIPAPFASGLFKPRIIARASLVDPGGFTGMTSVGTTILSPLSIEDIVSGGKTYALRMNADTHPQTDWARVTCLGVDGSSACNRWQIAPTGSHDGATKNVGYVEQTAPSAAFVGLYYFTFDIIVSK